MKKIYTLIVVMSALLLTSCGKEKSIYPEDIKFMPVMLQGSDKWSILNIETGELVAKDAFKEVPSPVVDDMFWVYNDQGRIDIYNIADCKTKVNKENYGSATTFSEGYAIVSKPGEPLQVINKQCETVAQLSPSVLSASMFRNGCCQERLDGVSRPSRQGGCQSSSHPQKGARWRLS